MGNLCVMPNPLSEKDRPETIHIRVGQPEASRFITLAAGNRRSIQAEGLIAIEAHILKHRVTAKSGAKMPRPMKASIPARTHARRSIAEVLK